MKSGAKLRSLNTWTVSDHLDKINIQLYGDERFIQGGRDREKK